MNLKSRLDMGLQEMRSHPLRTLLTMASVACGMVIFITLYSMMEGTMEKNRTWLRESGGLEKVIIDEEDLGRKDLLAMRQNRSKGRTLQDAKAIMKAAGLVDSVSPETDEKVELKRNGKEQKTKIQGATPAILDLNRFEIERGRFICDLDNKKYRSVVVLGSHPVEELFGNEDALGKFVTIKGRPFQVVGLLKKKAAYFGTWNALEWKNKVGFVPLSTVLMRQRGNDRLDWLNFRVSRTARLPWAADQVRNIMLKRHGVEDFKVETNLEWAENDRKQEVMHLWVLAVIAGMCMLSGGIGIMNIMLAAVKERTREIGVRRALGARRRDILNQFLLETLVLGVLGATGGVGSGILLIKLLSKLPELSFALHFWPVAVGFLFSVLICLFFGLYPAWRASQLDPIEALRND